MPAHVLWTAVGSSFIPAYEILAPRHTESHSELRVKVVVTTIEETRSALKTACDLSTGLQADIDLVLPEVVPYPLALSRPAVPPAFLLQRLMSLAAEAEMLPSIHVYLCRDRTQTLIEVLAPHSIVVLCSIRRCF